jgi:hypothetical protein
MQFHSRRPDVRSMRLRAASSGGACAVTANGGGYGGDKKNENDSALHRCSYGQASGRNLYLRLIQGGRGAYGSFDVAVLTE